MELITNYHPSSPDAAEHLLRMREVNRIDARVAWKRKFSSQLPMFVLVSQGSLIVRRERITQIAFMGDVVLLTPGTFELTAVPLFADGSVRIEYAKIPMSVFGKQLSRPSAIEEMAVGGGWDVDHKGIHIHNGMLPQVMWGLSIPNPEMTVIESVLNTLIVSLSPVVIPFLREVYYRRRWAFLVMMEAHTLCPRPVEFLAARYLAGRAAFFRDCRIYTGCSPAKWFQRRRMELADAWIHGANRTVPEVAAILHYDDVRLFRLAFRKYFRRLPEDSGHSLWRSLSLEDPFCCLRPFWWPAPMPLLGAAQWPGLRPEEFPEGFEEVCKSVEASPEPCAELPAVVGSDLPPGKGDFTGQKPIEGRFRDLEMIPVADLIPFPTSLPELLKAA